MHKLWCIHLLQLLIYTDILLNFQQELSYPHNDIFLSNENSSGEIEMALEV